MTMTPYPTKSDLVQELRDIIDEVDTLTEDKLTALRLISELLGYIVERNEVVLTVTRSNGERRPLTDAELDRLLGNDIDLD